MPANQKTFPSYAKYKSDFEDFQGAYPANGSGWLEYVRRQGIAAFDHLGFPTATQGNERWKYTNVTPIARAEFDYPFPSAAARVEVADVKRRAPWDEAWRRLVFVDGAFAPALSSPTGPAGGAVVAGLGQAISRDGALVEEHLGRLATVEDDGFTAMNTAFLRDGAFVSVPPDGSPDAPLHLVFVATARGGPAILHPRTLIVANNNSRLTVVESYVGMTQGPYFTNAVTEMVLERGARVEHYRYMAESADAFHIGATRVRVGENATFESTSFSGGARIARNDLSVLLDSPGGSCVLNGLYATSGKRHIDNHIDVDHASPHCTSHQYFKGILDGQSRAVFSGRVLVRPGAQKTVARQADKNLVMSDGARINTKPSLEIFADDVQCSHGATAGALAKDALFYLQSRGLDEQTATALLVHGFASEIIERVRLKALRRRLDRDMGRLRGGHDV